MTAVDTPEELSLPAQLRRSAVLTWHELPRVIGACGVWLLSAVPLAVAALTGIWWLMALSAVPIALLTTGLAGMGVRIWQGERTRVRDVFAVDAVLALVLLVGAVLAERAISAGGLLQPVGFGLAAVFLVIAPLSLSYGPARGRRGLAAIRGGAILAAYRPSVALTVLALTVLAAFAVAATLGTLGLVLPALIATCAAAATRDLLATIDSTSSSRAAMRS